MSMVAIIRLAFRQGRHILYSNNLNVNNVIANQVSLKSGLINLNPSSLLNTQVGYSTTYTSTLYTCNTTSEVVYTPAPEVPPGVWLINASHQFVASVSAVTLTRILYYIHGGNLASFGGINGNGSFVQNYNTQIIPVNTYLTFNNSFVFF